MNSTQGCYSVAVSSPGGVARQYRVQYQSERDGEWRMFATFRTRDLAEECEKQLKKRGYASRIVAYSICPFAS
jgi:hypothetical protein